MGYKLLVMVLGGWFFFSPGLVSAQIASKVILYNSAYDYFRGDQLEYVTHQQIVEELKHYPPAYYLIGLGAVTDGNWPGAVMVSGTVAKPVFYQMANEEPHLFQAVKQDSFPWLELAICNPSEKLERKLKGVRNIHQFVADQLQSADNIRLAAIKINGTFTNISYSLKPKAETSTSPEIDSPQEWELLGLYFRDYELQLAGAVSGRPVILFGMDSSKQRGGYVYAASAVEAKVVVYPLAKHQLKQSDLSIAAAKLDKRGRKLLLRVKNGGELGVRQVRLKMTVPGTVTEDEVVISIPAQGEIIVEFNRPERLDPGQVLFHVDPQEVVSEFREDNNVLGFNMLDSYLNQRR